MVRSEDERQLGKRFDTVDEALDLKIYVFRTADVHHVVKNLTQGCKISI